MARLAKVLALFAGSCVFALLLGEAALRVATPLPITEQSNRVPDDVLLYRTDPALPDVDARGFRNPEALKRADVVAIGDSHTYGYNVESEGSWPAQLASMTGRTVYNMSAGGYSIFQYAELVERAMELEPGHVIVALYPANDFHRDDTCGVLALPAWHHFSADHCRDILDYQPSPLEPSHFYWLATQHSALVNGYVRLVLPVLRPPPTYMVGGRPVDVSLVEGHRFSTNTDGPNVTTHEHAERLVRRMVERAGGRLSVMIVPSKERAYALSGNVPNEVASVVAQEIALATRYAALFATLGVPVVDITDQLASATYPEHDGHPLEDGYHIYAEAARDLIHR